MDTPIWRFATNGHGPEDFDPDRVRNDFGAPFALLAVPVPRNRWLGQLYSDSSPTGTPVADAGPALPVRLTIRHTLATDEIVDVVTRRTSGADIDLLDEVWACVVDRRLADPATDDILELQQWAEAIARRRRPPADIASSITIDTTAGPAVAIIDDDLTACGRSTGDAIVAVVLPSDLVPAPAIRLTWVGP